MFILINKRRPVLLSFCSTNDEAYKCLSNALKLFMVMYKIKKVLLILCEFTSSSNLPISLTQYISIYNIWDTHIYIYITYMHTYIYTYT